jgi:Protein of unknown function DUF262/Protein of unknown function (DUF1524)
MFQPLPTASISFGQLFADPSRFTVPIYQRPYSWTVEEVAQLLEDIAGAAGLDDGQPIETDYFLGAILLLNANGESPGSKKSQLPALDMEIVDGQQRLLTLTILAAVARDLERSATSPFATRLDALIRPVRGPGAASSRIGLSGNASDFFSEFVLKPGSCERDVDGIEDLSVENRAVLDARNRLRALLVQFSPEQRQALADYLCDHCHFVVVTTSDIDRAHRIFMVLNDRGRPLQKKDILKAEILRAVAPSYRDEAVGIWTRSEAELGGEMEAFFSHLRAAYGYHRQQVISGVRQVVKECGGAQEFIEGVFLPLGSAFSTILSAAKPSSRVPDELRRSLVGLQRLSGTEWIPSALLILSRVDNPELARAYLDEIERAAFLMRLMCLGSGKRQTRFAKIAALLSRPDLPAPRELYQPSREEMRTVAYNLKDLHSRNVQACKALLLRLNDELQPEALFSRPSEYTVEHVLPQRPKASSLWRRWFPDSEERVALTSSLGNLILVSPGHNDRARNNEYDRKKQVYSASRPDAIQLAITDDVLRSEKWCSHEIRHREGQLIALLNKLWRLDIDTVPVEEAIGEVQ